MRTGRLTGTVIGLTTQDSVLTTRATQLLQHAHARTKRDPPQRRREALLCRLHRVSSATKASSSSRCHRVSRPPSLRPASWNRCSSKQCRLLVTDHSGSPMMILWRLMVCQLERSHLSHCDTLPFRLRIATPKERDARVLTRIEQARATHLLTRPVCPNTDTLI